MAFELSKAVRLKRAAEFRRVREEGTPAFGRYMILNVLRFDSAEKRIGIVTSRKVGNAVARNRIRRRLREIIRHQLPSLRPGTWVVTVARHTAAGATSADLLAEWLRLAARASILSR